MYEEGRKGFDRNVVPLKARTEVVTYSPSHKYATLASRQKLEDVCSVVGWKGVRVIYVNCFQLHVNFGT